MFEDVKFVPKNQVKYLARTTQEFKKLIKEKLHKKLKELQY